MQRVKACKKRLEKYLNGEISKIDELEETLLDFWGNFDKYDKFTPSYSNWGLIASPNRINE